jgi:3-phenylpropionate/trans-cinnamate dioxygenase ferredoxin reductase subunit
MGGEQTLSGPDLTKGVDSAQIRDGDIVLGHADGEPVLLTRCAGDMLAVGARCPHYGGPLNEGLIVGDTIRCPWHHAAFSLRTGAMLRPPALADLPCWTVEERDGKATVTGRRAAVATPASRAPNDHPVSVVIIGGGAAGAVAAETLRRGGYDRPITIVEGGPNGPVDRPNLSKDYLAGTAPEEWIPLRPESFYAEQRIELLLGKTAAEIDIRNRHVVLDDGSTRSFGALLIATGSSPVTLDMPNAGQRVHYLRTLADSRAIIQAASRAKHAVVLGASFIGLEVAASLRARGLDVTVVAPDARPLERVLGPELGDAIRAIHEEHGVHFRLGETATVIGEKSVTLRSGANVPADLVVAGIGVRPNTALAEAAGLRADRGILVDEFLETSVPGIFAAGDVARWPDAATGDQLRIEHWVVAERQGQVAARNILAPPNGTRIRFDAIPFFWSQHYDVAIAYVGHASTWDDLEVDGDPAARDCTVTYRKGGQVRAVATIFRDHESLAAELAMERRLTKPNDSVERSYAASVGV